jgi:curved DNA-binding protein CbpA
MTEPKPTATGTLQATPVAHLLVYMLDRRLDGTLVVETPLHERSAFWFEKGAPAKAKTAQPVIHLGRLLLEMGAIDEATYNRTLAEVAKQRQLHGRLLVREGAIQVGTLKEALREQVARQVLWLCTLPPETLYGFYEGQNLLTRWGGPDAPRATPLELLWRVVRLHASPAALDTGLSRVAGRELRFHPDAQLTRFHFGSREQAVIDVLRMKPQRLDALLGLGLAEEQLVKRLVYLLVIARHLDLGVPGSLPVGVDEPPSSSRIAIPKSKKTNDGSRRRRFATGAKHFSTGQRPAPSSGDAPAAQAEAAAASPARDSAPRAAEVQGSSTTTAPRISQAPPRGEGPEVAAFKTEIRERAEAMADQDYYVILGVPRDADDSAIQAAFFQLAKRWHPDRLGAEYEDVREHATRVFSRMTEAHHVLTDAEQRQDYDGVLEDGGGSAQEQEQVQQVLRAATSYQKAQVLLKKHDLAGAEEHILRALADDPAQADYMALLAWIRSQKPDAGDQQIDECIATLNQAVSREPNNERARFYRGQLLKRRGKAEGAVRDFRWIVGHNPKHVDAQRELRLYDMRHSTHPREKKSEVPKAKSDTGGLFGRFFKK